MRSLLLLGDGSVSDPPLAFLGAKAEVDRPATVRVRHLDTFEWSLHQAGCRLTRETEGGRTTLRWQSAGDAPPYALPFEGRIRFSSDLPEGHLRSELEDLLDLRALLPLGEVESERYRARLLDPDGNSVVRLQLENLMALSEDGEPVGDPRTVLAVEGLPGHRAAFRQVVELATGAGAVEIGDDDLLEFAAGVRGRRPGDYSSKPRLELRPGDRSDGALREILLHLLDVLEANVDGVIRDLDVEFLHDLRVATRRTRSAISLVKGVLPADRLAAFTPEFKWLGTVTGPLRDLDVYQIEMRVYRDMLGSSAHRLEPLERLIVEQRRRALRRVRTGLRSKRFRRLVDDWRSFLENPEAPAEEPANAARPIGDLAGARIFKAYKRIIKRGGRLDDDPPAAALHQLRIDAKKLRYLLEFFAGLYPAEIISGLVKELKQLQDILGGFNDMEVQRHKLEELADLMMARDDAVPATVLAMGRLAAALEERQEGFRHSFSERFGRFADSSGRKQYTSLFGGS
jgi:CHAD domain-containing protein